MWVWKGTGGSGTRPSAAPLTLVLLAALALPSPGACAEEGGGESREQTPLIRTFEVGGSYGRYPDGLQENADAEFVSVSFARTSRYNLRLETGRQHRFGETSLGIGAQYVHQFANRVALGVGLSGGSGELIPRLAVSASVSRPFFKVGCSLGVYRYDWRGEALSEGVTLGLQRWFPHWILDGSVRHNVSQPGDEGATSGEVGATYYLWRKTYVRLGYQFGDARYRLVNQGGTLVDYGLRGFRLGISQYVDARQGFRARLEQQDEPRRFSAAGSWFTEW